MADAFADQPLLVFPGVKSLDIDALASTFLANGVLRPTRTSRKLTVATLDGDSLVGTASALARIKKRNEASVGNNRLTRSSPNNLLTLTATMNSDQRRAASEIAGPLPRIFGMERSANCWQRLKPSKLMLRTTITWPLPW